MEEALDLSFDRLLMMMMMTIEIQLLRAVVLQTHVPGLLFPVYEGIGPVDVSVTT